MRDYPRAFMGGGGTVHLLKEVRRFPGRARMIWYCNNGTERYRCGPWEGPPTCRYCVSAWAARTRRLRGDLGLDSWGQLDAMEVVAEALVGLDLVAAGRVWDAEPTPL